ncbi:hypothetical protein H696_00753 [Fonticula alba]|uniref:Major facilitator superfamily (MFS) profile domain-containing protein n=1 Tax=Fonticula alba TaxID=691883 RepID=A0A058ZGW7_FONAL|nr:hypothetical protein H696_00753 [Fonticula alba]KCV73211.1 hypothetical protein H696_00753 [Fonticula alba]|eukprot:XP_009492912.1 hypothetical protein H696_00753 [Fonticula alba]
MSYSHNHHSRGSADYYPSSGQQPRSSLHDPYSGTGGHLPYDDDAEMGASHYDRERQDLEHPPHHHHHHHQQDGTYYSAEKSLLGGGEAAPSGPAGGPANPDIEPEAKGHLTFPLLVSVFIAVIGAFSNGFHTSVLNTSGGTFRHCDLLDASSAASSVASSAASSVASSLASSAGFGTLGEIRIILPDCFYMTDGIWGTIIGIFSIGGLLGSLTAGYLSDKFGRRRMMLYNTAISAIGTALMAISFNELMFGFGRFFAGFGAGVTIVVVPTYIGEMAPVHLRGTLGVMNQLSITFGILFANTLSLFMSTPELWRWLISFGIYIPIIQAMLLPFAHESPKWLYMKKRFHESRETMSLIRGIPLSNDEDPTAMLSDGDLNDLDPDSLPSERPGKAAPRRRITVFEIANDKTLFFPLLVTVVLLVAQQFSGINAIFFYSTGIFSDAFPNKAGHITVAVSAFNVFMTIFASSVIDRLGRRFLLLVCHIGMIVMGVIFTAAYVSNVDWLEVLSVFLFVAFFAVSLGPIPVILLSEVFPTHALSAASSVALAFNWISTYTIAQTFPLVSGAISGYAFLPFVVALVLSLIFTWRFVPETRGRPVNVNHAALQSASSAWAAIQEGSK